MIVNVDKAIPFFRTDSMRLKQILINLISNSIKFTEVGFIELRIEKTNLIEDDHGLDTFNDDNKPTQGLQRIKISVIDTGKGISIEKQKNLFNSLTKEQSDTNILGAGYGLGIVKNLCLMLDSDIHYSENEPSGSIFYFTLSEKASINENNSQECLGNKGNLNNKNNINEIREINDINDLFDINDENDNDKLEFTRDNFKSQRFINTIKQTFNLSTIKSIINANCIRCKGNLILNFYIDNNDMIIKSKTSKNIFESSKQTKQNDNLVNKPSNSKIDQKQGTIKLDAIELEDIQKSDSSNTSDDEGNKYLLLLKSL